MNFSDKEQLLNNWYSHKTTLAKLAYDHDSDVPQRKVYQRGIYLVKLGENIGREMSQTHPALVISSNFYNNRGTATILPLTSSHEHLWKSRCIIRANDYPPTQLPSGAILQGLDHDSVLKADQPKTASVERFSGQLAILNDADWRTVIKRLKTYLGFSLTN